MTWKAIFCTLLVACVVFDPSYLYAAATTPQSCEQLTRGAPGELPWMQCPVGILAEAKDDHFDQKAESPPQCNAKTATGSALPWDVCPVGVLGESRKWFMSETRGTVGESEEEMSSLTSQEMSSSKTIWPGMIVELDGSTPSRVLDAGRGFIAIVSGDAPFSGHAENRLMGPVFFLS